MSTTDSGMHASAFDPLAAMQALEAAGVDRKHAEAHAAQLRVAANADLGACAAENSREVFPHWRLRIA